MSSAASLDNSAGDYARITRALDWLCDRATEQPDLHAAASAAGLSPAHFQRVFSRWVGVSPKRFLQVLTVERARDLLARGWPVLAAADELGLSSGSRLHDHCVSLEAATPGEIAAGGAGILIVYGTATSPFGQVFVALTPRGICRLDFVDAGAAHDDAAALHAVRLAWPAAALTRDDSAAARAAADVFGATAGAPGPLSLHVRGTNFQVAVWRALLEIPPGALTSYAGIASRVGKPGAARAVGAAVGANPVGFAIPCHRVIRQSGELGGYRWGISRKRAMHSWELARGEPQAGR